MAPSKRYYKQVLEEHRQRLDRLADRRGLGPLKKLYDDAVAEQEMKLRARVRGPKDTFTMHQHRFVLAQVKEGQARLAARMAGELGDISREAQKEAVRGLVHDVARLEKEYTGATVELPLEEAARFRGIIDKRRTSLLRMHEGSMARYGARSVKAVEKELSISLMTGETQDDAITRVTAAVEGEWWQAERIVRTETAWAYNASHKDAIAEAAEDFPDLMMQWEEMVDEEGNPYDDRVALDSLAMHGQVAPPGGLFYMPPTTRRGEEVPESLVGGAWEFPPNRPNDRAVLSPWRQEWGIPGWQWKNGRRVPMRLT